MNENKTPTNENRVMLRMTDDLIAMIRELVQLSLLTGTNVVDHLRAIVLEPATENGKVTVTPEYVEAYNAMIRQLAADAEAKATSGGVDSQSTPS